MRGWGRILVAASATVMVLFAVTLNGSLQVLGTLTAKIVDFTASTSTAPMKSGTLLPPTCGVGQAFFKTDAPAGQNIYLCTATDSWTQVQGSGGTQSYRPSSRYIAAQTDFMQVAFNMVSPIMLGGFGFLRYAGSQNMNNPMGTGPSATATGYATISTTSTLDNYSFWILTIHNSDYPSAAESLYARTDLDWEAVYIFRLPTDTDVEVMTGLCGASSDNPPNCMGVSLRPAVTGANLQITTTSNNSWGSTNIDTGVAAGTNWHKVKVRSDASSSYKIWVSVDNGTEYSICPSGCNVNRGSFGSEDFTGIGFFLRTKVAAQRTLQLDYAHFYLDRGAER